MDKPNNYTSADFHAELQIFSEALQSLNQIIETCFREIDQKLIYNKSRFSHNEYRTDNPKMKQ